ncbi:hypothetical protein EVAR_75111_1 [Eumeta japonica]|uniref:Uncharacterized protein n=1 Tax=Eumeta variegata TaxID=151549 RepID=A0A4C1U0L5_EUMVA|nr:hypothetical protein EVAR_75111_1 [Eumeta japonica]
MLVLHLDTDEEDISDLIERENASHLSETDKLEKRIFILVGNEAASEYSPTAPLMPPAARSETNGASLRNTDSSMSESTLADAVIFATTSASKETSSHV